MGVVAGCRVPPAGSTVRPIRSTGQATGLNSGLLLILLAVAYWPGQGVAPG